MKNEVSKVRLSKKEMSLLAQKEFFEIKKNVTDKIYQELAELVAELRSLPSFKRISFPSGTDFTVGKISKGENYLGLPFIILDFPRLFSNEQILAFRIMIWWGNFVSCTFITSVNDVNQEKKLSKQLMSFKKKSIYFCIADSPWHHHFGEENYVPLSSITSKEMEGYLAKNKFLKLARRIPLNQINRMKKFSIESFELFATLI